MTTQKISKINFYNESIIQYKKIREKNNGKIPSLLLHVCCGACSCYPLVYLSRLFNITIYYSNSNIFPKSEYDKRLNALKDYVKMIETIFNEKIKIVEDDYDYFKFEKDLLPFKDEEEGGNRCKICIKKRLIRLFQYAKENNYSLVGSVMSISRNKDVFYLNECGKSLEKDFPNIEFFYSDFKKNNGQDIGVELSKKFCVYRQCYCGCRFSKSEGELK